MLDRFLALDAFLAPRLVRPFYLIGCGLALLWGMVGLLFGLILLVQVPWAGLLLVTFALMSSALGVLACRLAAEAMIAQLRMHARFVGGGPLDPIPE